MNTYTFVTEPSNIEIKITSDSYKSAHKAAWDALSELQRNSCASLECVEEYYVPDNTQSQEQNFGA